MKDEIFLGYKLKPKSDLSIYNRAILQRRHWIVEPIHWELLRSIGEEAGKQSKIWKRRQIYRKYRKLIS